MDAGRVRRLVILATASCFCVCSLLGQTQRREVIRGEVTSDSGVTLAGARISITRLPDRSLFRTVSDGRGAFAIAIDSGTGDYLVYVAMDSSAKFGEFRVRLRRQNDRDSVFLLRVVLPTIGGQSLTTVLVTAERPTPERSSNVVAPSTGAVERVVLGVSALTMPEQRGDLATLGATVPGVGTSAGGLSALGISGQSSTTLNGLSFAGASVPRDIRFTTRVSTSTFDPSRGWFGGAESAVQIEPGSYIRTARASATFDARTLQSGDNLAARLGQQYTSVVASIGADGYTLSDHVAYSVGVQGSRRAATVLTPVSLDADVLSRVGLSTDSAARAIQALSALGIPLAASGGGDGVTVSTASLLARINTPEFVGRSNTRAKNSLGLILYAYHQSLDGIGSSPLELSTRQSARGADIVSAQVLYSTLNSRSVAQSFNSSVSYTRESLTPKVEFPAGEVNVRSTLTDGTTANSQFGFGGGDVLSSSGRLTWESQTRTAFYPQRHTKHLIEFTADARFDRLIQDAAIGSAGRFVFADLASLAQNRPTAFTRTLRAPEQQGGVWNGFLAASDTWKPFPRVKVMLGLRAEANFFTEQPERNPDVRRLFGVNNESVPNRVNFSPRFGFVWRYSDTPATSGYFRTDLGTLPIFSGGIVRGGFGKFASILTPDLAAIPFAATGLAGSATQLACVGSAVPSPEWQAYSVSSSGIPSSCPTTVGASSLRDAAPSVRLIDRQFTAAESWRANLGWSAQTTPFLWSLDATLAWNRNQASEFDLNFTNTPRFLTSDEGRPVFVSSEGIVPSTGAVSPTESRRITSFGRVVQARSDLWGTAQQVVLTVVPNMRSLAGAVFTSFSYTLGTSQLAQRGFDNTTFVSPVDRAPQRTDIDIRNSILAQVGINSRYATLTLFGRFASGQPFTPLIQTDVNGDGLANDRAFVFDPDKPDATVIARDMRTLLSQAPAYARKCLDAQRGRPAAANSCTGPWTATLSGNIASKKLPWHDAVVSLSLFNLPGALDQLLHGQRLKGWGNAAAPDAVLLTTYGFDAAQNKFLYRVNPRFGDSRGVAASTITPFRINLDVRVELGPSQSRQLVRRLLSEGRNGRRGNRLDVQTLVPRLRRSGPQPYRELLELGDSLALTEAQLSTLERADDQLRAQADTIWTELATWLAGLPDRYDEASAVARQESATDRVWEISRQQVQAVLRPLLTPRQIALLPWPASELVKATSPITGMRIFDYRDP
jgi:hypothetical protein